MKKENGQFWQACSLNELPDAKWEALCDGCGRCCVWKFEDEDSGEILYTDIRCHLFNDSSCRCNNYPDRVGLVPDCLDIRKLSGEQYIWLPESCAYRLLHEGKPLFNWHPLISGDKKSVHTSGFSMRNKTFSGEGLSEEDIILHIIDPDEGKCTCLIS